MENVLKGFAKTFSLDCEKDKTATSTVLIPPFFSGVILIQLMKKVLYLSDKDEAFKDSSAQWQKGLRVFYSCENYWKVE